VFIVWHGDPLQEMVVVGAVESGDSTSCTDCVFVASTFPA
jgi:hypothetical protein